MTSLLYRIYCEPKSVSKETWRLAHACFRHWRNPICRQAKEDNATSGSDVIPRAASEEAAAADGVNVSVVRKASSPLRSTGPGLIGDLEHLRLSDS